MHPSPTHRMWFDASCLWKFWTTAFLVMACWGLTGADQPSPTSTGAAAQQAKTTQLFTDQEWSQATPPANTVGSATPVAPAVTSIVVSLLVVIGMAVGLALLVKRFGSRRLLPNKGRHMEVVEHLTVGYKRSVSMVRIGNQLLVLGQGEHELNHLATLPASLLDLPRAAPLATDDEQHPTPLTTPSAFRKTLDKVMGRES